MKTPYYCAVEHAHSPTEFCRVHPGNLSQRLAEQLRVLRAQRKLTQERAAALIGCDYKYYQRIEAGLKDVRLSTLERIANAFGVGVEELLEHSSRETRQGSR